MIAISCLFQFIGGAKLARVAVAQQDSEEKVTFQWKVPTSQVEVVRKYLKYEGDETQQTGCRNPVIIVFAGAILLVNLAQAIIELQRRVTYGGIVVDARSQPLQTYHDKALDAGVIIIIGNNETKIIEREPIPTASALVDAIGKALQK